VVFRRQNLITAVEGHYRITGGFVDLIEIKEPDLEALGKL